MFKILMVVYVSYEFFVVIFQINPNNKVNTMKIDIVIKIEVKWRKRKK